MAKSHGRLALAIDIGGTQFRIAIVDGEKIVARERHETDREQGAPWMIDQICRIGKQLIDNSPGQIEACGIGFGGPVDFRDQRVMRSLHVDGWQDVYLSQVLSDVFHVPCIVDNDANAGALGEYYFGAARKISDALGRDVQNMIYMTVSTGIGGGLILNGKPYRGSRGHAGELGHLPIFAESSVECSCGQTGCLEAYCSGLSIARRAMASTDRSEPLTAKDVFEAAEHDPKMGEVITQTINYLGTAIAGMCNVLDPDCIVIGGGVSRAGDAFIQAVGEKAYGRMLFGDEHRPPIVAATLEDDTVLWGAYALTSLITNLG